MSRDIDRLLEIMAALRDPRSGCPWDVQQTFATIAPYTLEEAYEVAEAIADEDMEALRHELGDLLFQVVFHARMAAEAGLFDFGDVVAAICSKMTRRHPHVFGDARVASAAEQSEAWERHKEAERRSRDGGRSSHLDGVGKALPALVRAGKLQRRAARVGFDWDGPEGVMDKLHEEFEELEEAVAVEDPGAREAELGDLLFTVVNLARHLDVEPETALRRANGRFEARFRHMEHLASEEGTPFDALPGHAKEALWAAAKAREKSPG